MPIVVILVSAKPDDRPDVSSLDLSSEPIKKRRTEQEALGFRARLRIPQHADLEAVVWRLTRTTTSRPWCSVPVSVTRSTGSRRLWPVTTQYDTLFNFPAADPTASDRSGYEHVSRG